MCEVQSLVEAQFGNHLSQTLSKFNTQFMQLSQLGSEIDFDLASEIEQGQLLISDFIAYSATEEALSLLMDDDRDFCYSDDANSE